MLVVTYVRTVPKDGHFLSSFHNRSAGRDIDFEHPPPTIMRFTTWTARDLLAALPRTRMQA